MGNLNKRTVIYQAEKIVESCEEKYKEEGKNKKKVKELEKKCKKLKRSNIIFKILLVIAVVLIVAV